MREQMKIFVAGSRRISRLSKDVRERLDNIAGRHFTILIGDANGVDKAVQQYLSLRHYQRVVVFCMEGLCRNNLGAWQTRAIAAPEQSRRDFLYYSVKDQAMVEEAHYGLMLWDGSSRGTLRSIVDLVRHRKPVIVYVPPEKSSYTLHDEEELAEMLARCNARRFNGYSDQPSLAKGKWHPRENSKTPSPLDDQILSRSDWLSIPWPPELSEETHASKSSPSPSFSGGKGIGHAHRTSRNVTFKRAPRAETPQPVQLTLTEAVPAKPRRKRR